MSELKMDALFRSITDLSGLDNEELFVIAYAGNEAALVKLYNSIKRLWYRLCQKMHDGSRTSQFEDWTSICTEEFFLKWKLYDPIKYGTKFSTFIVTVVHNRLINEIRHIQSSASAAMYNPIRLDGDEEKEKMDVAFHMYDSSYFAEYLVEEFTEYVRKKTSPRTYAVMLLKHIDGLGLSDIANELGVSRCAVSNHLRLLRGIVKDIVKEKVPIYVC